MTSRACPQCHGFGTTIPHPCPECSGDGRVQTRRTLTVKIPPGVDTGTRIQLAGEGEVGFGGGDPGDLYLEVLVLDHPLFARRGRRPALHAEHPDDRGRARAPASRSSCSTASPPRSTSAPARSRVSRSRCSARVSRSCAAARAVTSSSTSSVETPTRARRPAARAARPSWPGSATKRSRPGSSRPGSRASSRGSRTRSTAGEPPRLLPRLGRRALGRGRRASSMAQRGITLPSVRRVRVGEQVVLTDGRGTALDGRGRSVVGRGDVACAVHAARHEEPASAARSPSSRRSRRVTAASSPSSCSPRSVSTQIVPWQAERCVSRWKGEKVGRGRAKWALGRA